jgi:NADH-quinone oxidoreductase subunit J
MDVLTFYAFAAIAVAASLLVVGQRNPMYSVMLLIAMFGALAGLYVLLDAPFIAVIQIIIYAGAIMVLFLFVVMLLNAGREDAGAGSASPGVPPAMKMGAVLSVLLGLELVWALSRLSRAPLPDYVEVAGVSSVARIGRELFTRHAFAFEATSILILVAMIGAIVLARRER